MAATVCAVLTLAGCSSFQAISKPTAESLSADVTSLLGVRPGEVVVTDIQTGDNKTFFKAKTPKGLFECSVDSGILIALSSPGINRRCNPVEVKATPAQTRRNN